MRKFFSKLFQSSTQYVVFRMPVSGRPTYHGPFCDSGAAVKWMSAQYAKGDSARLQAYALRPPTESATVMFSI